MRIWFDITNTPQVHFLLAIKNGLQSKGFPDFIVSARDFSETKKFLEMQTEISFKTIGKHEGRRLSGKAAGLYRRFLEIHRSIDEYDISISCGSESAICESYLRRKPSIAFGDNDLARQWTYGFFVTYAFFPSCIPVQVLKRQGLNHKKLYQYDGLKEHVYIAGFKPDNGFISTLPFNNYVVVRPENIMANYVQGKSSASITPRLLKLLSDKGINILFLPRYTKDHEYAKGIKGVFIPENPVSGLDACYFSDGVFTGAGTFAREAACLGIPSFSFFMGPKLLAVDKMLIDGNAMFYSRDPGILVDIFMKSVKKSPDLGKAKEVNHEVISKTIELINKMS